MELAGFTCTICGDSSSRICVYCTKDTCRNHLCHRCRRCSDCCTCDSPLNESLPDEIIAAESIEILAPLPIKETEDEDTDEEEEELVVLIPSSPTSEPL